MNLTAADIANDFDLIDNLGTVSVQQINALTGAVIQTATGVTVLKRAPVKSQIPVGEGEIQVETVRFHLKASTIAFVPKERDKLVDGSETWKIGDVTRAAFATRYVCECVKERG